MKYELIKQTIFLFFIFFFVCVFSLCCFHFCLWFKNSYHCYFYALTCFQKISATPPEWHGRQMTVSFNSRGLLSKRFRAKKPIFVVLDAREMGRERKNTEEEGRARRGRFVSSPLPSPPPPPCFRYCPILRAS